MASTDSPLQRIKEEKPIWNFSIDPASSIRTSIADTTFAGPVSETPISGERQLSGTDMTGRPGYRTMEMIGGSSASYLARTPCVPLLSTLFNRGGNRRAFRLSGAGGGSFPLYGGTSVRSYSQRFSGGVGGRGLATNKPAKRAPKTFARKCPPSPNQDLKNPGNGKPRNPH